MMINPKAVQQKAQGIEGIFPSYANQGDTDVTVTVTLNQQTMVMIASDVNPLSIKIGTLEGRDIIRNGLEITAVFDIPADEPIGMKNVSIEFPAPEFSGPDGFTPPDGFAPPDGFTPPIGFTPPDGFQPPSGGFPGLGGQSLIFTEAEIFEIRAIP